MKILVTERQPMTALNLMANKTPTAEIDHQREPPVARAQTLPAIYTT